jgi:predicted amidohydrolase
VNLRFAMLTAFLAIAMVGPAEARTIRIAVIQMNCKVGELDANLAAAEKFVRKAFEKKADMVILPEFFTTPGYGFPFDKKTVEAVQPLNGRPMQLLKKLAQEHKGIVGGSFLAFHDKDVFNSFVLAFPDGKTFFHNKDYPTGSENCYYTGGNDDGVFETPIGNIGVALCWEYVRSGTARRMLDRVDIVIGGSCWPGDNPETDSDNPSLTLLKDTPNRFARLLGVPVVHSNHVGIVQHPAHDDATKTNTQYFLGEACIVDGRGKTISGLAFGDGEGVIVEEVTLGRVNGSREPIPEGFWIPDLPKEWIDWWTGSLSGDFREYYENTARPACRAKWGTP